MHSADRDVDRFVLVNGLHLIVDGDERRSAHDDPMLRAMMVLLERKALTRLHDDPFDLVALAVIDRLIAAPRTMDLEMVFRHLWRYSFQFCDQPLETVGVLLTRDEDGILRRDDHEVVDALKRDQRLLACDIAVAGILEHGPALCRIALGILVG